MTPQPTDLPAGHRRTVLVTGISIPTQPSEKRPPMALSTLFRTAARILARVGLHQGDYLPDVFDRRLTTPHSERPMCLVAALRCAATGDPHRISILAGDAIRVLADRLVVNGEEGPYGSDELACEFHLAQWGDEEGRTTEAAVGVLERAADATAVTL
ncbi:MULTISPECIES: DUF6197 family protein [Streptomyces]|uniref:Uncharacterized protein n=1 Tax=Streptomyces evansiae TaxID=3075535 RepID=A0ABU2R0M6_9ACTN|nr:MULTISPECIES: hypothetical protein [unclassified Streptomyces]MDT0409897.1 hypothetical protein [Streptomyces sp. DSM 41979]SCE40064.1 hypothetical protein GA0115252_14646 [Streptomyces sp. DfronAA-171]